MTDFNGGYGTNPDYAGFPSTGGLFGQGGYYSGNPPKPPPAPSASSPGVSGSGYTYNTLDEWPSGFPAGLSGPNAYPAAANFLLEGSGQAQRTIRQGYEDAYTSRITGIAGAQNEMNSRMGAEAAAGGYSPDLIRKMMFSSNAGSLASIGASRGDSAMAEADKLSEIQLGTGTELSDLKLNEIEAIIQAYEAKLGLQQANKAGNLGLAGSALGAAGSIIGGGLLAGGGAAAAGGGLGAAAGIFGLLSDDRMKENVERVGTMHGVPVVQFSYITDPAKTRYEGVLASDVEHMPGIVRRDISGLKVVDYAALNRLTGVMMRKVA